MISHNGPYGAGDTSKAKTQSDSPRTARNRMWSLISIIFLGFDHVIEQIKVTFSDNVTHTQPFYSSLDFVRDNPGEPVPEETFTHSHLSWSSVIPYLLPPCFTIRGILSVQFTCLAVFFPQSLSKFSLDYLLAWHPPFHTPYNSSPNHCLIFAAHAHTITTCFAEVLKLCHQILVSQPFTWKSIL